MALTTKDGLAESSSRCWPFVPFNVNSRASASGCAILLMRAPASVSLSSATILQMTIPSKAIIRTSVKYMFHLCIIADQGQKDNEKLENSLTASGRSFIIPDFGIRH